MRKKILTHKGVLIMKIVCSKELLNKIVGVVQKAIGAKTSYPILECIKIETSVDGTVIFTANSIELCIEYTAEMPVYESGSVALPSRIFGEIVRRLPDGDVIINSSAKNFVTDIECDQSKFNIQGMSPQEFPSVPIVDEHFETVISQGDLKQIVRKVSPFISQTESRKPVLTGALFEFNNDMLTVVGTDSHRLAVVRSSVPDINGARKLVIPGLTLSKLSQLLSDSEEDQVRMVASDKNILFDFGKFQVYSRLLEGEFLRYEVILSASNSIKLRADKQSIINSLERASLIINDELSSKTENKMPVRLNISSGRIDISCKTSKGYVNDSVRVEQEGGDLLIGFNCRFMLDALNACDEDSVVMELSVPTGGCFVRPEDGSDRYTYMILPVRLYN